MVCEFPSTQPHTALSPSAANSEQRIEQRNPWLLQQQCSGRFRHPSTCLRHHHTLVSAGRVSTECTICFATEYAEAPCNVITLICVLMCAVRASAALVEVADDAVTISFVTERSVNGVRTVDVVRALQSDTIQDVKLRLRTRGHHVTNGHALVSNYSHSLLFPSQFFTSSARYGSRGHSLTLNPTPVCM